MTKFFAVGLSLSLVIGACGGAMSAKEAPTFMPARELREFAGREASKTLADEIGETLPFPRKGAQGVEILVLYYKRVSGLDGESTVLPPHYAMILDGQTGQVRSFGPIASRPEFGLAGPLAPLAGVVGPDDLDVYETDLERLLEVSAATWASFATGDISAAACARAREYWALFRRVELPNVAPFYAAASPEFFDYLRAC